MTDENKHIDQLIQDKLLGYEEKPPAHIWTGVRPSVTMLWVKGGIAAAFILAATALAYYWLSTDVNEVETAIPQIQEVEIYDTQKGSEANVASTMDINNVQTVQKEQSQIPAYTIQESSVKRSKTTSVIAHKDNTKKRQVFETKSMQNNTATDASNTQYHQMIDNDIMPIKVVVNKEDVNTHKPIKEIIPLSLKGLLVKHNLKLPMVETLYPLQAGKDFKDIEKKSKKADQNRWAFGMEFSPEWTKLQESGTTIQSYGIDFSVCKYFNNFYLASGVGLSYSTDNGKYQVDYKKSEYQGSYQYVDSVSFEVNNDNVTPTYHTTRIDIYDTIDKVRISENQNKYLYINIPLYMGFEYSLGKRWQMDLYAGLRSGILVYKDIPNPKLEDNVFLVKSTYNNRKDFYLQGQIGIGLHYQLHKHWYLGFSPNISYYFTSPIANETKKPYALGLRFGIRYKWNR